MGQRTVSLNEREQIYLRKRDGCSLRQIVGELGISYECVRKWWRRCRSQGLAGLVERKRGRKPKGILSQFPLMVQQASLRLKRQHKR